MMEEYKRGDKIDYYIHPDYDIPHHVINNPKWVRKELDENCLDEIKCKECGNTKLLLQALDTNHDYDSGVYYYRMKLVGVCPCGCENEFLIFTTHTKVCY